MTNFFRALRSALRYRWTLIALLISSLMVAILWGANLGTIYPIVGVVLKQRSLHDWVDESISDTSRRVATAEADSDKLELQLASNKNDRKTQRSLARQNTELRIEQKALANSRKLKPWIVNYMPSDPFATLGVVVSLSLIHI